MQIKNFRGNKMKKIIFTLTALTFVVCSAFADYVVLDNELTPYVKTNEVVSSFNTLTGDVNIEGGSNVTLSTNDNVITISASGGEFTQVQSDWNEDDTTDPAYIANKPTIPTVPELAAGSNVSLSTNNNVVTISATDTVFDPEDIGIIPSGGESAINMIKLHTASTGTIEISIDSTTGRIYADSTESDEYIAYLSDIPHLVPGSNISIATNGTDITISATASGAGVQQKDIQTYQLDDADATIDGTNREQYYTWVAEPTDSSLTVTVPEITSAKIGYIELYLDEQYHDGNIVDLSEDNIIAYPTNKPWLTSEESLRSTWKVELENVPASTNWYFVKAVEYIIEKNAEPTPDYYFQFESGAAPTYSTTSTTFHDTTSGNEIDMTCSRLNKGTAADDKKIGDAAMRLAPLNGSNAYFYNTTAFSTPVASISFKYAKYGTGSDTCQSFVVSTSTDGSTWTELADLTSDVTESLQTYSNNSTIPSDTYFIKFEATSSVSGNTRRLDVDEIKIYLESGE